MSEGPGYGILLRSWLPAVWRERDATAALQNLLAAYGELLDALHATVEQRLDDSFPDQDESGRHSQDWLLPYIARLLDVRLVSPDEGGRRAELRDGVAWRQRKGTRVAIEAIAEAVGRFEVETQEGWKRLAITPRVDRALLPEAAYGEPSLPSHGPPSLRARHPGLPAATLDLRRCSRALRCAADNPAASRTRFGNQVLSWRQVNRHGLPCAQDSFQDVSRRTLDTRTPDWRRGLYHPRRVLLHYPPPEGFFPRVHQTVNWSGLAPLVADAAGADMASEEGTEPTVSTIGPIELRVSRTEWNGTALPQVSLRGLTASLLRVRGVITLDAPAVYVFENLWLDNRVEIKAGAARLLGCAARNLLVSSAEREVPVIDARGCLFKGVEAPHGLLRLEYATVLKTLLAAHLECSDSILMPRLRRDRDDTDVPMAGCVRFSRLFHIPPPPDPAGPDLVNDPIWVAEGKRSHLRCIASTCTTLKPLFWSDTFGQPGCAVLRPQAAAVFQTGAEDGGELGACHDLRYVLRRRAVADKLREFLPVGMDALLVPDPSLTCPPPQDQDA